MTVLYVAYLDHVAKSVDCDLLLLQRRLDGLLGLKDLIEFLELWDTSKENGEIAWGHSLSSEC